MVVCWSVFFPLIVLLFFVPIVIRFSLHPSITVAQFLSLHLSHIFHSPTLSYSSFFSRIFSLSLHIHICIFPTLHSFYRHQIDPSVNVVLVVLLYSRSIDVPSRPNVSFIRFFVCACFFFGTLHIHSSQLHTSNGEITRIVWR